MADIERIVCASDDLVEGGGGVRFLLDSSNSRTTGFVIRSKGRIRAYLNRCSHLPTELDSEPGKFFDSTSTFIVCSLHGAAYSPESGGCLYGPCGKTGLVPIDAWEKAGSVIVSLGSGSYPISNNLKEKELR